MKQCTKCLIEKTEDDFSWKNKTKKIKSFVCKSCHKKYRDEHYIKNKDMYIQKAKLWRESEKIRFYEWLSDKSCLDCGISDIRVLEFDHLYDKEFQISEKIGVQSLETLFSEIDKCEIVCSNCHKIRTAERGNYYKFMQADKA